MGYICEGDTVKIAVKITKDTITNSEYIGPNFDKCSYLFEEPFEVIKVVDMPGSCMALIKFININKLYRESLIDKDLLLNIIKEIEGSLIPTHMLAKIKAVTCIHKWQGLIGGLKDAR